MVGNVPAGANGANVMAEQMAMPGAELEICWRFSPTGLWVMNLHSTCAAVTGIEILSGHSANGPFTFIELSSALDGAAHRAVTTRAGLVTEWLNVSYLTFDQWSSLAPRTLRTSVFQWPAVSRFSRKIKTTAKDRHNN